LDGRLFGVFGQSYIHEREIQMKSTIAIGLSLVLLAACGCTKGTRGGGQAQGEGFKLSVPMMNVSIKQGEVKTVTVKVDRAEYFKRDVTVVVRSPEGLKIEPTETVVRASDKPDMALRVAVPQEAPLGEYRVYVTGTPESGAPSSADFTVKVVAP
jgi:hypothetical protein